MASELENTHSKLMAKIKETREKRLETIIEEQRELNRQLRQQVIVLVTSAMGLVAALAWNEAIQAFFKQYLSTSDALFGKFLYALLVTALAVTLTYFMSKITSKKVDEKTEEVN